jgi:hypothetical protein
MFGWTRFFTLVAVAAALAIATGGAGATSKPTFAGGAATTAARSMLSPASMAASATVSQPATAGKVRAVPSRRSTLLKAANLSTRAGAARYLRAIGVDPRGLVIQRGARNYAGPSCPGAGWACTSTAHPVIQIAAAGGKNTFLCTSGRCAVVQTTRSGIAAKTTRSLTAAAATNKATCIKTTGLGQSCSISQNSPSANNEAIVYENITKASGLTQTASSTAQITQRTTGSNTTNKACVFQIIDVTGSTVAKKGVPVTVALEAHQSISITQDSATGGNSLASASSTGSCAGTRLMQTQTLTSKASGTGSITQNENKSSGGPNMSLNVRQNQSPGFINVASGANAALFTQENTLTAVASTPAGPVNQTQSSTVGGIQATVNQFSTSPSSIDAIQNETQCEDYLAAGPLECSHTPDSVPSFVSQEQHGPVRKDADSVQSGNSASTFTVTQGTLQFNDTGQNQTNVVQGACSTDGNCGVTQNTNVNGETSTNTQAGSSVDTQTNCTGNDCTSTGSGTSSTLTLLPTGFSVTNTDVAEFGVGGMRGAGTGSITVSGITSRVAHAFLYWHGPTNSADPASNAAVTFNGTPITGTNTGTASDNNWGFQNSQAYRADVTSLVTGNGAYSLSSFLKADADINGVALIVFYDDGTPSNDRTVVAWNGNDSNIAFGSDPGDWDETISGVPYPGSGSASLDFVVGDGQSFSDADLVVNGSPIATGGAIFQGDSGPNYGGNPSGVTGSLWDVKSFDITSLLTSGSNDLHVTSGTGGDALSLVVALANVPPSAAVIP